MSGILQKSARKAKRVRVEATCTITVFGSGKTYAVEILDLSVAGMAFAIRGQELVARSTVQVDFRNLSSASISVRGKIVAYKEVPRGEITKVQAKAKTRYSVQFEIPLSDKQFTGLLSSFDLSTPEIMRKAR